MIKKMFLYLMLGIFLLNPIKSNCKEKFRIVDFKEIVCITEGSKVRVVWFKDKTFVEKLLNAKWEELYYYHYPFDTFEQFSVTVRWRPLKTKADGLFLTNKEFKKLPPHYPQTLLTFGFYNPKTKNSITITINFSAKTYSIEGPSKDERIDKLLFDG
ncbi:MAG: hypothetical protein N2445_08100 [Acidobacteria bacterium]|nr:hypothetical protein [Acidobacteriota bacterium]